MIRRATRHRGCHRARIGPGNRLHANLSPSPKPGPVRHDRYRTSSPRPRGPTRHSCAGSTEFSNAVPRSAGIRQATLDRSLRGINYNTGRDFARPATQSGNSPSRFLDYLDSCGLGNKGPKRTGSACATTRGVSGEISETLTGSRPEVVTAVWGLESGLTATSSGARQRINRRRSPSPRLPGRPRGRFFEEQLIAALSEDHPVGRPCGGPEQMTGFPGPGRWATASHPTSYSSPPMRKTSRGDGQARTHLGGRPDGTLPLASTRRLSRYVSAGREGQAGGGVRKWAALPRGFGLFL